MTFPKLKDIKSGDVRKADVGCTCLDEGQLCEVRQDERGRLFVDCGGADDAPDPDRRQRHYLDGQENGAGECVGFERVESGAGVGEGRTSVFAGRGAAGAIAREGAQ